MEIVWNHDKAAANPNNHTGVTFEEAKRYGHRSAHG